MWELVAVLVFLAVVIRWYLRHRWKKQQRAHAPENFSKNVQIFYDDEWDWR